MAELWISSRKMTVWVKTKNGIIVDAAPIVRKFIGQHCESLKCWMRKQRGLRVMTLRVK